MKFPHSGPARKYYLLSYFLGAVVDTLEARNVSIGGGSGLWDLVAFGRYLKLNEELALFLLATGFPQVHWCAASGVVSFRESGPTFIPVVSFPVFCCV